MTNRRERRCGTVQQRRPLAFFIAAEGEVFTRALIKQPRSARLVQPLPKIPLGYTFNKRQIAADLNGIMTDTFSKVQRSQVMRSVHSTGTGAEKKCEELLRSLKLTFRRHAANLPGRPDFILKASRVALFVHGCFWHAHKGCNNAALPSSNLTYWVQKIERNRKRDRRVRSTVVIWECKLRDFRSVSRRLLKLTAPTCDRKKLS